MALPRSARRARHHADGDDGFMLLESIITITLITIVMTALAAFFVTAVNSTSQQRARQLAVQVASTAMEQLRAVNATDLLSGHDEAAVSAQFGSAPSQVAAWLTDMRPAYRDADTSTAPVVPVAPVDTVLNNVRYSATTYLGTCWIQQSAGAACSADAASGAIPYLRAVVAVTWQDQHCGDAPCVYLTSTLLNALPDPVFDINQVPPPVPIVADPDPQLDATGDSVSLQLAVVPGTGAGVSTWQLTSGTLPPGLGMNPAGLISGQIAATASITTYSATVEVTDVFGRTATGELTWRVVAPIAFTAPLPDRSDLVGDPIAAVELTATGGTGSPYTFRADGLPPGIALTGTTISGTPTAPGTYPVTVTATDSAGGRARTVAFTWTVSYKSPVVTTPSAQTATVGQPITALQLRATGGSGSYTWTASGLPAGLQISADGAVSGTPEATGTSTVTVAVHDTVSGLDGTTRFTWTVYTTPSIAAPAPQQTTTGGAASVRVTATCPNAQCTFTLAGAPAGLSIGSAGVISGTVTSAPGTFGAVTVTVTDAAGATASTPAFAWTVAPTATWTGPGNQTAYPGTAVSLTLTPYVTGGTGPFTYYASGLPSWLTFDQATGVVSGTAPADVSVTQPITVSVVDASGATGTSAAFQWAVSTIQWSPLPAISVSRLSTYPPAALPDYRSYVTGGTGPVSYVLGNLPPGLTWDATSGNLSGQATTAGTYQITATATDQAGAAATTTTTMTVS